MHAETSCGNVVSRVHSVWQGCTPAPARQHAAVQAFNPVAGLESIVQRASVAVSSPSKHGSDDASGGGQTGADQGHGGQVRRAIADIIPG